METDPSTIETSIIAFLDHLAIDKSASIHTIEAYRNDLKLTAKFLTSKGVGSLGGISSEIVAQYESSLNLVSRSTAQRRLSSFRSFLKFARRESKEGNFALPSGGGFKKPKILPKSLPIDEIENLLKAIDPSSIEGLRDRTFLELTYGTGMRVSEAVGTKLEHLNLHQKTIRITGKREKTRLVPIPTGTLEWVESYLESARPVLASRAAPFRSTLMILNNHGKPLLRQNGLKIVVEAAKRAGLPTVPSPHTLRHSYAVHLLKGGADLRVVQELLGHASLETTQIYTQLDLEEVKARFKKAHPRG